MAADRQEGTKAAQTREPRIMDATWCGLDWTPWVALEREAIRQTALGLPGVYRIRHAGGRPEQLVYVGQTGRTLRERLLSLGAGANAAECPFNDPHTAAPHLWLLQRLDGARLECSCASVAGDVQVLRGTEDMLLWRHRVETGLSAEANYGRFYPGHARPTNRWIVRGGRSGTRTPGRKAVPLSEGEARIDFTMSGPALQGEAGPLQASWWQRAALTEERSLPSGPAVYRIHDRGADEPVYVGETTSLPARALTHAAAPWPVREPWLAYLPLPEGTPKHVLRELESDLLGWHFWRAGRAPALQYAEATRKRADA
jgi:hypothetical protein